MHEKDLYISRFKCPISHVASYPQDEVVTVSFYEDLATLLKKSREERS